MHHPRNIMKSPDEDQGETSSNKDVSTATTATAEAPHEKKPSAPPSEDENDGEDAADSSGPQLAFKELMDVKERETFPEQLMKILDEEMAPNAMWWMPDGKAFAIKLDKVAEEVLDKFFQGSKYATFTRRLNKWGFRKAPGKQVQLPPRSVVFFHTLFRRDEKDLIKNMSDKRTKKSDQQASTVGPSSSAAAGVMPSFTQQQQQAAAVLQQPGQSNLSPDFLLQQMLGPNAGGAGNMTGLFPGANASSIYQLLENTGSAQLQGFQQAATPGPFGPIAQFLQHQQSGQQQQPGQQQFQQQQYQQQPIPNMMTNNQLQQQQQQRQESLEEFLQNQQGGQQK